MDAVLEMPPSVVVPAPDSSSVGLLRVFFSPCLPEVFPLGIISPVYATLANLVEVFFPLVALVVLSSVVLSFASGASAVLLDVLFPAGASVVLPSFVVPSKVAIFVDPFGVFQLVAFAAVGEAFANFLRVSLLDSVLEVFPSVVISAVYGVSVGSPRISFSGVPLGSL